MSDLHREKTRTSTLEQSRRLRKMCLKARAHLPLGRGGLLGGMGGRPGARTNQVPPRGSCLHCLWRVIWSVHLSQFGPRVVVLPRGL